MASNALVKVIPISHASAILEWGNIVFYTDPVGDAGMFVGKPTPDVILVTDIHSDHFVFERLEGVMGGKTIILAPSAVVEKLPASIKERTILMNNGGVTNQLGFKIEAIPAYNIPESKDAYHPRGRGNGYVIEKDGVRVYIAGDTSGIPEMRALKNIEIALVPMNLPYTMSVEEAAEAVLEFKPKYVYPYHYRESMKNGFSDVAKFKTLVNAGDPNINVILLNWYP